MKVQFRIAMASVVMLAATLSATIDAQAQAAAPVRKSIKESIIKLPEYFGFYAVQKNGEVMVLKPNITFDEQHLPVALPEDVEFLIYGKDVDPSIYHLVIVGRPPNVQLTPQQQQSIRKQSIELSDLESETIELLAKNVSNQAQMLRLIPACTLPNGVYVIASEGDRLVFSVGPVPKSVVDHKANSCMNNLRQIAAGKEQWCFLNKKSAADAPSDMSALVGPTLWLKSTPVCPDGGTYTIGAVSDACSCSIHGTVASPAAP